MKLSANPFESVPSLSEHIIMLNISHSFFVVVVVPFLLWLYFHCCLFIVRKMEEMLEFALSISKSETHRNPDGYF